jgi:rhodanese-related sulfurtransferase
MTPETPPTRTTIHDLLADARSRLDRLTPAAALAAMQRGAILVDTRTHEQRRAEGAVPGARRIDLSVLEWELDPVSGHSDPSVTLADWIVLICSEGYSSSLAAARLKTLGFARATDVIGGVAAWREGGLPLEPADGARGR